MELIVRRVVREEVTALARAIDEVAGEKSIKADYDRLTSEFDRKLQGRGNSWMLTADPIGT